MSYERIISRALRTPWALTPEYLAIVQDVLIARAKGVRLSDEDLQLRIEAKTGQHAASRQEPRNEGVIAVIPIYGVIAHRSFEASSGATSTEFVSAALRRAVNDPSVKAIVLDISSPGGTVEGVPELAAELRLAKETMPIVAFANALAASAAYWLAATATEIVVTPSGCVGSVGVYCLTEDWSEYLAKEGIKINAISAGEYKLEGAPWEPMTDEARAFLQANVDATYRDFLAAVAKGRGVSVADVKKNYGQGRVLDAKAALAAGMVDKIGTFPDVIARANALSRKMGTAATVLSGGQQASTTGETCPDCGGSGLKPERHMGDPQGQEPCPTCSTPASAAAAIDQAAIDRDAIAAHLAR